MKIAPATMIKDVILRMNLCCSISLAGATTLSLFKGLAA
jgi:hypothetical protein